MKLTILQVGQTPEPMRDAFGRYPNQFQNMFQAVGADFAYETIFVIDGEPLPDPSTLEGSIITGSAAGVYDDYAWMEPLRDFVRQSYTQSVPMLGICFGHQIMADAMRADVRKSDKGWGLGRHVYDVSSKPPGMEALTDTVAIAASHQDQVIVRPIESEVFLSSEFTPNAGLYYDNGAAISMQPHPEFDVDYSRGLVELRRGDPLNDAEVEIERETLNGALDNNLIAASLARFFERQS